MAHPCISQEAEAFRALIEVYGENTVHSATREELVSALKKGRDKVNKMAKNVADQVDLHKEYFDKGGKLDQITEAFKKTPKMKKAYAKLANATPEDAIQIQRRIDKMLSRRLRRYGSDLVSGSGARADSGVVSVEARAAGVFGDLMSDFDADIEQFLPTLTNRTMGIRKRIDDQYDIVRELHQHGSAKSTIADTRDAVSGYAKAAKRVLRKTVERMQKAGKNVRFLDDWNLPQMYNHAKVGATKFDVWYRDMDKWLDKDKVIKSLIPDEHYDFPESFGYKKAYNEISKNYEKIMQIMHTNIGTEYTSKAKVGMPVFIKKALGNQGQEHRIMHFRDAESWIAHDKKYGIGDPTQAIHNYIEHSSRDIAAMETFGYNPDAFVKAIKDTLISRTGNKMAGNIMAMSYENLMGKSAGPTNTMADAFRTLRNVATASKLSYAPVSALTDIAFGLATASFNNMPAHKYLTGLFKTWTNVSDRRILARKLMVHASTALDRASGANRYSMVTGFSGSARTADWFIRAGGLNHITEMGQITFSLEMMNSLSDAFKAGNKSSVVVKRMKRMYGFTDEEIDIIANSKRLKQDGLEYIYPASIENDQLRSRLVGMVREEVSFAVPESSAKVRAVLTAGTKANTVAGELIRSFTQFKTFPTTILLTHMQRGTQYGWGKGLAYLARSVGASSVLGYGVMMAKEALNDHDPLIPITGNSLARAVNQGGGLGLVGDFMLTDYSRYGLTVDSLAGPVAGMLTELAQPVLSSPRDALETMGSIFLYGDKTMIDAMDEIVTGVGERTVNIVGDNIPNTWYTRTAFNHMMRDWVKTQLDENYEVNQRRLATQRKNYYGQDY